MDKEIEFLFMGIKNIDEKHTWVHGIIILVTTVRNLENNERLNPIFVIALYKFSNNCTKYRNWWKINPTFVIAFVITNN